MFQTWNITTFVTHLTLPAGVGDLLGLSLPFCLQAPRPNQDIGKTMSRLRRDVRRTAFFANSEDEPNYNYNPKLHIPSTWEPPRASNDIERRMDALEQKLEQIACENQRKKKQSSNITRKQWAMIKYLRQNDDFMIVPTDKNLGPAIIERSTYKWRVVDNNNNMLECLDGGCLRLGEHSTSAHSTLLKGYYIQGKHMLKGIMCIVIDSPYGIRDFPLLVG